MATMFHSMEVAKTHEIMARYRPIAPKPALPQAPIAQGPSDKAAAAAAAVSLHLRGRHCRARKRGRGPSLAPIASKRQKTFFPIIPSPAQPPRQLSPTYPPVVAAFSSPSNSHPAKTYSDALTLTLLPRSPPAAPESEATVPVEQDLLQKLQEPRVIVPQPVRPVGSSISVGFISQLDAVSDLSGNLPTAAKGPEEVEEEVESEDLPAVISDSHNRVRLANSAYKEMVGQPECLWLDAMMDCAGGGSNGGLGKKLLSRRISGEVMLDIEGSSVPSTNNGFSCRVKIEWASNGRKNSVNAPCNVTRLFCKSKDYLFAWRFNTSEASIITTSCSA